MKIYFWPSENKENKYIENFLNGLSASGVENVNKPCNSFVGKIFSALMALLNPDVKIYHFNWIENFSVENTLKSKIKICLLKFFLWYGNLVGKRFVWTMHNTIPHKCKSESDIREAKRFFRDWIPQMDLIVVHAMETKKILQEEYNYPESQILYIPHGRYEHIAVSKEEKQDFKREYGIRDKEVVFLLFGLIDEYKNVPLLIKVFRELSLPNAKLMICGRYADNLSVESRGKIKEAKAYGNISVVDRFIKEEELPRFLECADVVVLPYKKMSMQNSGAAILAMSYYKPVIVSRFGYIKDISGFSFVYSYEYDSEDMHFVVLKDKIQQFYEDWVCTGQNKEIYEEEKAYVSSELDWKNICQRVADRYKNLANGGCERGR